MNVKEFYSYIKNPPLLNEQTLHELSEVIERYPYFQAARMLYLKNLSLLHDDRYQSTLTTTSLYAPDRKTLFNLIHDKEQETSEVSEKITITAVEEKAENTDIEINIKSKTPASETIIAEEKNESPIEIIQEATVEKAEQLQQIEIDKIKEKPDDIINQPLETKEERVVESPIPEIEKQQEPNIQQELKQPLSVADHILQRINEIKKKNEATENKQETISNIQIKSIPTKTEEKTISQIQESSMTFDEWLYHLSNKKEEPELEKNEPFSDSLIDSFLNNASNISRIKADPNSIQNDLTENMTQPEESEIITESLAQLYYKQGYFEKSLIMYQKLILKYPEKSIYFAPLIEELKNKLDKS